MTMQKNAKGINILINNFVPLNNGDVALVYALYRQLIIGGYKVEIASYDYKFAKELYPKIPLVEELGQSKIFMKLPFIKPLVQPFLFIFSKPYRNADIIIGAAGGYINSNYSIKNSLSIYKIAKYFGKKCAIYSQSVGPLNDKDSKFFKKLMKHSIDYVFVRDTYSLKVLNELNISKDKFRLTKDAAFLLEHNAIPKTNSKKVAISVREWNYDGRSIEVFEKMIQEFIKICVDRDYTIEFLSTCQGLKKYKDDAKLAQEIFNNLDANYQQKVTVLSDYYLFDDFYKKLEDYEFVIGTRLHMCITSLTKNIPAFNISYVVKGKECYNYLNLSKYSIDYNENLEKALTSLNNFIDESDAIRKDLENRIPKINKELKADFDFFMNRITLN